jgi:alkanesulfonate monooxygenase SsuD/methylene tetrahydromethanopterin reductase-like flavin-dependent oxidoreductase (luciferase family)
MSRPLRVGLQLPEVERVVRWPEYLAIAKDGEAAGFDSLWVGDHLLYRGASAVIGEGGADRGPWDAFTMLAALAAATERVVLGPLVACLAFHPPGMIARMASAIDEISGGRFVLGVGSGWNEPEFRAFGFPFDHLASRFLESFEIVRRLLAGETVQLAGAYHAVEDAVLLPEPARRTPLMIGTNGPRQLAATLPHVDAWNTWFDSYGNTPEGFAALNATIDEAAITAGREPAAIARSACVLVSYRPVVPERPRAAGDPPAIDGDPATLAAHLRALAGAGADEAILVLDPITGESARRAGEALALLDG